MNRRNSSLSYSDNLEKLHALQGTHIKTSSKMQLWYVNQVHYLPANSFKDL